MIFTICASVVFSLQGPCGSQSIQNKGCRIGMQDTLFELILYARIEVFCMLILFLHLWEKLSPFVFTSSRWIFSIHTNKPSSILCCADPLYPFFSCRIIMAFLGFRKVLANLISRVVGIFFYEMFSVFVFALLEHSISFGFT